ncbi:MAG: ferrous iron transport protein A [Saccharofermentans sp.]|nr:ferrous iron transport protein A [Saccharofermentans sp.]
MMPLALANVGEEVMVFRVSGDDATKQHLADLGFVPGTRINIITQNGGDVIVNLKESHLAITKKMAQKIMVQPA